MAKNKIIAQKRGVKPSNLLGHRKILPFVIIAVVFIGIMFFVSKYAFKAPAAEREAPVETEKKALAGQAIAGFGTGAGAVNQVNIASNALAVGTAAINPSSGTAVWDSAGGAQKFTVEIVAYPQNLGRPNDPNFNKFDAIDMLLTYDKNKLEYKEARFVGADHDGYSKPEPNGNPNFILGDGTVSLSFTNIGNPMIISRPTAIIEVDFEPKADQFNDAIISLTNFKLPTGGVEGLNVPNAAPISTISLRKKFYRDMDRDGFGNQNNFLLIDTAAPDNADIAAGALVNNRDDCQNDDPALPAGVNACPVNVNGCTALTSRCGICINPSMKDNGGNEAVAMCDGADNDCDGLINDEIEPTCADLGVACGIHRICQNTKFKDCNQADNGALLSGADKCGNGQICNDGQCVAEGAACGGGGDGGGGDGNCVNNLATCTTDLNTCNAGLQLARSRIEVFDFYTPSCGNNVCQTYEHMLSCPEDCNSCPPAAGAACIGAGIADADNDGLSDAYETYLNTQSRISLAAANPGVNLDAITFFNSGEDDSDGDGVNDNLDYCPGTANAAGGLRSLVVGTIGPNGCYTGDIKGNANPNGMRPDGCYVFNDFDAHKVNYHNLDARPNPFNVCSFKFR